MHDAHPAQMRQQHSSWKGWLVFFGFLAIVGYLLTTEHRIHTLTALPFLIFLACPLMMMFMHHGDNAHGGSTKQ